MSVPARFTQRSRKSGGNDARVAQAGRLAARAFARQFRHASLLFGMVESLRLDNDVFRINDNGHASRFRDIGAVFVEVDDARSCIEKLEAGARVSS